MTVSDAMLRAIVADAAFTRDRVGAPGSLVRQRADATIALAEEVVGLRERLRAAEAVVSTIEGQLAELGGRLGCSPDALMPTLAHVVAAHVQAREEAVSLTGRPIGGWCVEEDCDQEPGASGRCEPHRLQHEAEASR